MWKPLLHEVAAGSMDMSRHELDYLAQAYWHGFRFRFGEMIGLDRAARGPSRRQYRRGGARHHAGALDRLRHAGDRDRQLSQRFRDAGVKEMGSAWKAGRRAAVQRRLVNACLRAHTQTEPVRPGQLHVAIIGAGATGRELSAELHRTTRGVVAFGLDKIDPDKDIKITLIEAADRVVPALPPRLSEATRNLLGGSASSGPNRRAGDLGDADGVHLADGGFIPFRAVVWAAGVRGPGRAEESSAGSKATASNQLVVQARRCRRRATTTFSPWAIAPTCRGRRRHRPVPPRAQAAHQQASHLLKQIKRRLAGEPVQPFVYHDFGSLVSLGEFSTVGSLMGFLAGKGMLIEGYVARLMYRSLYKMHETALQGRSKAASTPSRDFSRGAPSRM